MTILDVLGSATSGMPATSDTWTFSVTRDDIIRQAMLDLGLLEESEVPTAAEITDCARKLNMIVKQIAGGMDKAAGFKMFQRQRGELFLSTSKYAYLLGKTGDQWAGGSDGVDFPGLYGSSTLTANVAAAGVTIPIAAADVAQFSATDQVGILCGSDLYWTTVSSVGATNFVIPAPGLPTGGASVGNQVFVYSRNAQRPVEIVTAVLRDVNGTDTPLDRMTIEQYESLPTKTQPGYQQDPTAFYYEAQMAENLGVFYLDCSGAQDVTKHIHVVYLRQAMDFNAPGDAPEFPQEHFLRLSWELAKNICGMFDADWTQDREDSFQMASSRAKEGNSEVHSEYFQPDEDN